MLLRLLWERDMYGYELVKTIAAQSEGVITVKEGALYPVLYQFIQAGYVSERRQPRGERMVRIYYHLEAPGAAALERLTKEYYDVAAGMEKILNCFIPKEETAKEEEHVRITEIPSSCEEPAELLRGREELVFVPT